MRKEKITEVIGEINARYIDEATIYTGKAKKRRYSVLKWGIAAACLCLVLGAAIAIPKLNSSNGIVSSTGISDRPGMVMIDGRIYKDSGKVLSPSDAIRQDGQIISSCDNIPTENDQSNFGTGYGYQYGENNTINVRFDDGWHIFILNDTVITSDDLSEERKMELDPSYNP